MGINPIGVEEIFNTITGVIGPTIEIEVDQAIMGMEVAIGGTITPKTIEGIIIDKTMVIKGTGIGTEVYVRTAVGQGRGIEAIPEITSEIGHMIEAKAETEKERVETETDPVVESKDKG